MNESWMPLNQPEPEPDLHHPGLRAVRHDPFNAETRLDQLTDLITPHRLFYIRSNFALPQIDPPTWRLTIGGAVARPLELSYDELRTMPSRSLLVTLECAGNGRSAMTPPPEGEPWQYGAVGTTTWTGVPLKMVLEAAGLTEDAREIVVVGSDRGQVDDIDEPVPFARSLPLERALHPDTLLAYAMNDEPLPVEHGYPVRLIVPGWYGMASVKWVTRIETITDTFDGYFQHQRYVLIAPEREDEPPIPLTNTRLRSLITWPLDDARLPQGTHRVRGFAWSDSVPVTRVEVSIDGAPWQPAELLTRPEQYAWRQWAFTWHATEAGTVTLRSRAFDANGNVQPEQADWNRLGYANNAIQTVAVTVR